MKPAIFSEEIFIKVFHQTDDHDPFINAINGHLTVDAILSIEKELKDNPPDESGDYVYRVEPEEAQVGEFGRVEVPAYWDMIEISFEPI